MSLFANPEIYDEFDEDQGYDDYEDRDPSEVSLAIESAINDVESLTRMHHLVAEQLQSEASVIQKQISLQLYQQTRASYARRYGISHHSRRHALATESISGVLVLEEADSKGVISKIVEAIKKAFNWLIGLFKKGADSRPSGENAKKHAEQWFDMVKKAAESQKEDFKTRDLAEDFYKKVFDGYVDTKSITSGNITDVVKKHTGYVEGLKAILSEITGINDKVAQGLDNLKPATTATTTSGEGGGNQDAQTKAMNANQTESDTHTAVTNLMNQYKTDMGNLLKKSNGASYEEKFNVFQIGKEGLVIDKEVGFVMAPVITNNGTKAVCMLCYDKSDGLSEWDGLVASLSNSDGGPGKFTLPNRLTEMLPFSESVRDFLIKIGELNDVIKSKTGDIEKNSKLFMEKVDRVANSNMTDLTRTNFQPIQKLSQICGKLTSTLGSSFPGVMDRSHATFKHIVDDAVKQISGTTEQKQEGKGQQQQQGDQKALEQPAQVQK